jgi:RimJ/RimL family protein N-acetyltransferase
MNVVEATESDLDSFFKYLEVHLSENGQEEIPLFQPASRKDEKLPDSKREKIISGISNKFGDSGWKKLWLAKDESGKIRGHLDLRHPNDRNCYHRVLLGMGVDSSYYKQGIGTKLIEIAINFCQESEDIDWIDLRVLSENIPAKSLYLKTGFSEIGEFKDQYRIDGQSISDTAMCMCVKNYA